jgi:flagellar biosynthesis/type III secretory pathway M-ring protein FliF/YscJ
MPDYARLVIQVLVAVALALLIWKFVKAMSLKRKNQEAMDAAEREAQERIARESSDKPESKV